MSPIEFTRRVEQVAAAADAAIDESDRRLKRLRATLNTQQHRVYNRRQRALKVPPMRAAELIREADLIESVIEQIRKAL